MNSFKKGDSVILHCAIGATLIGRLTIDKEYIIIKTYYNDIFIINNFGELDKYHSHLFEFSPMTIRNMKIDDILG